METDMQLENRVAIISGATGGLGRVVTKAFAEQGAHLALIGQNLEKIKALAVEIGLSDKEILPISIDVSNSTSAQETANQVMSKFRRIDIYLHLIGGWIGGKPVAEVDEEDLKSMLTQHLWSTFFLTKAIIPHLLHNGWGRIVVISSPSAHQPPGKNSPYAIAKAAQEALILSLAKELKGSGVTANILAVKMIDTEHEKIKNPTKKNQSWTTPEEITNTILHLCTDEAGIVNGARIPLFGDGI
jgi:NAD(P)-dependent dehydrogenase (short-subunit alcohol dehydrogenase family)